MLKGSCLCGAIRYEIDADLGPITNCHCGQCRKASGAAFASNASVPAAAFRFVSGSDMLGEWQSSAGKRRCFCRQCGSPILKRNDDNPEAFKTRLDVYRRQTAPVSEYYRARGLLKVVAGLEPIDAVTANISNELASVPSYPGRGAGR